MLLYSLLFKIMVGYVQTFHALSQVAELVSEVEELDQLRQDLAEGNRQEVEAQQSREEGFRLSKATVSRQQSAPTGTSVRSESLRWRRKQTMKAACMIHGGSVENTAPATIGMIETLERNKEEDVVKAMGRSKKMKRKVIPKLYKEDLVKFESLDDNMFRSIAMYYSNGIMGRDKYRSVYKASPYKQVAKRKHAVCINVANCPIPKLVPSMG